VGESPLRLRECLVKRGAASLRWDADAAQSGCDVHSSCMPTTAIRSIACRSNWPRKASITRRRNEFFARSKLHAILRDRAYLGEVRFQEAWHPGSHEAIVEAGDV